MVTTDSPKTTIDFLSRVATISSALLAISLTFADISLQAKGNDVLYESAACYRLAGLRRHALLALDHPAAYRAGCSGGEKRLEFVERVAAWQSALLHPPSRLYNSLGSQSVQ